MRIQSTWRLTADLKRQEKGSVVMALVFDCPKCGTTYKVDLELEAARKFNREYPPGMIIVSGRKTCPECRHTIENERIMEIAYDPNA